jgi:hypothetical protein
MEKADRLAEFIDLVQHDVERRGIVPRTAFTLDAVLLALLSKGLTVGKAVCTLVENGFPEEAFGLSRTLIDIFFTVRYIANRDSFARADQYVKFSYKSREGWWKIAQKHFSGLKLREPDAELLEEARKYPNPHWWTGRRDHTKHIACEQDTHEVAAATGKPVTFEADYEIMYKWTSEYAHVNVRALNSHTTAPGDKFVVWSRSQKSIDVEGIALFNAAAQIMKAVIGVYRAFHLDVPSDVERKFKEVTDSV